MRLLYVVSRPTQFDAPLFRLISKDEDHEFAVVLTAEDPTGTVPDPELGRSVDWGIDLDGGYRKEPWPPPHGIFRFQEILALGRWDLVITNGYTSWPYVVAALAARMRGIPTALRIDSVSPPSGAKAVVQRSLFRTTLNRVFDLFLATGTLTERYLLEMDVPESQVGRFPYSVDVRAFHDASRRAAPFRAVTRAALGVPEEARLVLALAKFSEREMPWDVLRAISSDRSTGFHLVLAGDGPRRGELQEFAAANCGKGRVIFPGYVPYTSLPELYAAADLFVHPVREERWGVSVAEALACDLPVVASSAVGAAVDLVREGRNGFTYHAGDHLELLDRIRMGLALDRVNVARTSSEILAGWTYEATWKGLLRAAKRASEGAS